MGQTYVLKTNNYPLDVEDIPLQYDSNRKIVI